LPAFRLASKKLPRLSVIVPVFVPDKIILVDCNGLPFENTLPAILVDCAIVRPVDI
jgi:hypothetical protein